MPETADDTILLEYTRSAFLLFLNGITTVTIYDRPGRNVEVSCGIKTKRYALDPKSLKLIKWLAEGEGFPVGNTSVDIWSEETCVIDGYEETLAFHSRQGIKKVSGSNLSGLYRDAPATRKLLEAKTKTAGDQELSGIKDQLTLCLYYRILTEIFARNRITIPED